MIIDRSKPGAGSYKVLPEATKVGVVHRVCIEQHRRLLELHTALAKPLMN